MLRLYAENDRLKIRELEDRKRIQKLLGITMFRNSLIYDWIAEFTQPVEHEATYFRTAADPPLIKRGVIRG